ncbi:MAG: hypothetical protein KGZ39_00800 [Simkania sp.]|nr:hypothetical protein [Simkania sp.]
MAIKLFRDTVNDLRNPKPYFPVATECKGALNLFIGAMQFTTGQFMKLSSTPKYHTTLSARHVTIGTDAMKQGVKELLPGLISFLVTSTTGSRSWIHLSSGKGPNKA